MRKLVTALFTICLFIVAAPAWSALAADEPSNVTITVVMPGQPTPAEEPAPVEDAAPNIVIKVYPSDVAELRDGGGWQIIKTYVLSANEQPEDIPREQFERSGWTFTLTDITRKETSNAETREHTETVTLDTETNELEQILASLAPTMDYRDVDGFTGILSLDVSSIKVETAGTRTTSHTMTVTREYPNLSSNDTELVPKTVTDRGKTYTLASVDWRAGNTVTIDYERIPEYYTAVAAYTATGYSTRVTGYTTTATYSGSLAKLSQGRTVYTAYFVGTEIRTPLEMMQPSPPPGPEPGLVVTPEQPNEPDEPVSPTQPEEPAEAASEEPAEPDADAGQAEAPDDNGGDKQTNLVWLVIIPCVCIMAAGGVYFIIKRRKGKNRNEKTDNTIIGA